MNPVLPKPEMPFKDPAEKKEHRRQYYLANKERALAKMAEWRRLNPERHSRARLVSKLRVKYGLTLAQYHGLLESQAGACAICHRNTGTRALHIDHDHSTGKVRGLLCNSCNRGIGLLKDDATVLRSALAYLERVPA